MKSYKENTHKLRVTLIFLSIFCLFGATQGAAQNSGSASVKVSIGEYSPWLSSKMKNYGFCADVISQSFANEGITVEFDFLPWQRVYLWAKEGRYDATALWYQSDERKKDFIYSDEIAVEDVVFFHLRTTQIKPWGRIEDLNQYTIGAVEGYTYTREFWNAATKGTLTVEIVNREVLNLRKLVAGRIDLTPIEKFVGLDILLDEFDPAVRSSVEFYPKPFLSTTSHILFPRSKKASPALAETFNRGLKKLRTSGRYNQMVDDFIYGHYRLE